MSLPSLHFLRIIFWNYMCKDWTPPKVYMRKFCFSIIYNAHQLKPQNIFNATFLYCHEIKRVLLLVLRYRQSLLKLTWTVICHWKRQSKFFSYEPLSKVWYWLGVWHGLYLLGITRPVRSANREIQNEKFLPSVGFEPDTFRLRREAAKSCAFITFVLNDCLNIFTNNSDI